MRLRRPAKGKSKAFKQLDALMTFINVDDANKEDYPVKGSKLQFTDRKTIAIPTKGGGSEEFSLNEHSFGQLAAFAKIPAKYLASCKVTGKGGMQDQLESRLSESSGKEFLIRIRRSNEELEGVAGVVRAILPGDYEPFDNRHLLWGLQRAMKTGEKFDLQSHNARDIPSLEKAFHLRLIKTDTFSVAGEDPHSMGYHAVTSEVGKSRVTIAALVWRLVCTNGMMGWGDSAVLRLQHTKTMRHEVYPQMHEAIHATGRQEDAVKNMLEQTYSEPVAGNPVTAIALMGKRMRLSESLTDSAMAMLVADTTVVNHTKYNLLQAFTAAARDLPMQQRLDAEESIGSFMFGGRKGRNRNRQEVASV